MNSSTRARLVAARCSARSRLLRNLFCSSRRRSSSASTTARSARAEETFSSWPVTDHGRAGRKFGNISDEVDEGNMPPKKYTLIHRDAVLTAAQRQTIIDWADAQAAQMRTAGTAK